MKRKPLIFGSTAAVALAAAAGVALSARARTSAETAAKAVALPSVSAAEVKRVRSAPRDEITGALNPGKELKLGFEVGGRLSRILMRKGAAVALGQTIAQLDPELADAQVRQAEAAVKAAEAQAAIAGDQARRSEELGKSHSVTEAQLRNSVSAAAGAAAQVQAARAQLAQARASRRRHDLRAPFAGVLIDAPDQVGATVAAGATLFTLEQLDPLVLKLTVGDSARDLLKPGTRVHVEQVGGKASSDAAWVRSVIPSADAATRRVPVDIVVPNSDGRFTAHTLGRAVLPLGNPEDALSAPASALASQGGDHVYALVAGEVRRVAVEVIERGAERVVFRAPQPLDKVVDYPAPDLQDRAKVSVK